MTQWTATSPERADTEALGQRASEANLSLADADSRWEIAPWLKLEGVSKSWGKKLILDSVDLSLAPGSSTWLSGRNGVGKTTLLRILCGLILADSGHVELSGLDPDRDRREYHRRIGFLSAGDRGLYARLSVYRNLDFWARMALIPRRERAAAIDGAIERFQLEELRDRRVDRMSMGQRQRVRLAMTFLHEPHVVMLDEPRNSLDGEGIDMLAGTLDEFVARGGVALWCSPAGELADLHFDASYEIEAGKVKRI